MYYSNEESDDIIQSVGGSTKTVQQSLKNTEQCFSNLAPDVLAQKDTGWHLPVLCWCHENTLGATVKDQTSPF